VILLLLIFGLLNKSLYYSKSALTAITACNKIPRCCHRLLRWICAASDNSGRYFLWDHEGALVRPSRHQLCKPGSRAFIPGRDTLYWESSEDFGSRVSFSCNEW